MQKLFAISFSLLIVLQSLNIGSEDISKLNVLLEHAQYHQQEYGDSFFEFIVEHYADLDSHDAVEHEEHDDLPFKQKHKSYANSNSVFLLNQYLFSFDFNELKDAFIIFFYEETYSFLEKPSIFQPPKSA